MHYRLAVRDPQRLQQITGPDDVGVQRVNGGVKAGLGVALGRQMKYIVRSDLLHYGEQGHQIVEVGVLKEHPILVVGTVKEVLHIVNGTAPAADSVDVPIRVLQQIVRQVGAYHASDSGNKCFSHHMYSHPLQYLFPRFPVQLHGHTY